MNDHLYPFGVNDHLYPFGVDVVFALPVDAEGVCMADWNHIQSLTSRRVYDMSATPEKQLKLSVWVIAPDTVTAIKEANYWLETNMPAGWRNMGQTNVQLIGLRDSDEVRKAISTAEFCYSLPFDGRMLQA